MKKMIALLLSVLMLISLLSGCVSSFANKTEANKTETPEPAKTEEKEETKPEPSQETEPEKTPSDENVELEVWYAISGNSGETFVAQSEAYMAENSNVKLNMSYSGGSGDTATKVSAALLTNTQPDVALMYAGPLYTGGRGDYTIGRLMDEEGFDKDDIFEGMLDYCTYLDGGVCAVPYGISTQVLYYNKDILAAAGVDMTNPPKTWGEFYDVCLQVLEKGNINANNEFTAFDTTDEAWLFKSMLMQNGCQIIEMTDGTIVPVFNNAEGAEVTQYWSDLVTSGIMAASEHDNAENKFLAGNLAFIAASSNRISRWNGSTDFALGAIEMPCFTTPALALGGNVLVILTEDPVKVAAAWDYITYLTGVENNTAFALATGYLPIHKSALDLDSVKQAVEENEMYSVAFNQLSTTWAYTHFTQMGNMDVLMRTMLNKLEKGRGTVQELLDKAAGDLADEIAEG